MTAPDKKPVTQPDSDLMLLACMEANQLIRSEHQRVVDELRKQADEARDAALVAAADRLGHGYINTDHRGDTLFACNVVLDMRRKTEAE